MSACACVFESGCVYICYGASWWLLCEGTLPGALCVWHHSDNSVLGIIDIEAWRPRALSAAQIDSVFTATFELATLQLGLLK